MLEHDAVRHPVGHIDADTRDSEPVEGAARSVSEPSVGGGASVVVDESALVTGAVVEGDVVAGDVVAGDVVAGDVVTGDVVPEPEPERAVVVVAPADVVGAAVVGAAVVATDVVVVPVEGLRAMNVNASASVSV